MKFNADTKLIKTKKTKTVYRKNTETNNTESKNFPIFELFNLDKRIFKNMAKQMGITTKALHKQFKKHPELKQIFNETKTTIGETE